MLRAIVYVDGFNLYHGMRSRFGRAYHWLDLDALARSLLRSGQRLERVRYFTARVRDHEPSRLRQLTYLEALGSHCPIVEIAEGRLQRKLSTAMWMSPLVASECRHLWSCQVMIGSA